jgi:hypothetical protein
MGKHMHSATIPSCLVTFVYLCLKQYDMWKNFVDEKYVFDVC